jgi:hypothetical protein
VEFIQVNTSNTSDLFAPKKKMKIVRIIISITTSSYFFFIKKLKLQYAIKQSEVPPEADLETSVYFQIGK